MRTNPQHRVTEHFGLVICYRKLREAKVAHARDQEHLKAEIENQDSQSLALKERQQSLEAGIEGRDSQTLALKEGQRSLEAGTGRR